MITKLVRAYCMKLYFTQIYANLLFQRKLQRCHTCTAHKFHTCIIIVDTQTKLCLVNLSVIPQCYKELEQSTVQDRQLSMSTIRCNVILYIQYSECRITYSTVTQLHSTVLPANNSFHMYLQCRSFSSNYKLSSSVQPAKPRTQIYLTEHKSTCSGKHCDYVVIDGLF